MIEMGKTYKDKVTGFVGVATGISEYMTGCRQILLVPKVDVDGKTQDGHWFDEQRLGVLANKKIEVDNTYTPGPDMEAPKK